MSRNPKPSIDCPKEIVDEPDNVQGILENDFRDSYFRVCQKCSKTRILDKRAVNKFPLGSYYYAGQMRKIVFECSRLVSTDCSVPEDVVTDEREMNDPVQLFILKTKKTEFPSSGILIRNNNLIEETGRKKSFWDRCITKV